MSRNSRVIVVKDGGSGFGSGFLAAVLIVLAFLCVLPVVGCLGLTLLGNAARNTFNSMPTREVAPPAETQKTP